MKGYTSSAKGFSLMELMVVLIMMGFMAGIVGPALGKMLNGLDFRKDVGNVMANLRGIRLEAVVSGQEIELRLDENTLLVDRRDGHEAEVKNLKLDDDSELTMEPEMIIFTPQATVTPATISFVQGDRSRIITMDALSALPVIQ